MVSKSPDVICQCLYQLGCVTKLTVQGLHPFQSLVSHTLELMIKAQEWVLVLLFFCFILAC